MTFRQMAKVSLCAAKRAALSQSLVLIDVFGCLLLQRLDIYLCRFADLQNLVAACSYLAFIFLNSNRFPMLTHAVADHF